MKSITKRPWRHRLPFNATRRVAMYEKLAALMGDGIAAFDVLTEMAALYRKHKSPLYPLVRTWLADLRAGATLAESMAPWIPEQEEILIRSGEEGGKILDGLLSAAYVTRKSAEMRGVMVKEITYPTLLILMSLVVVGWFTESLAPTLFDLAPRDTWHGLPGFYLDLGWFVVHRWYLAVLLIVGSIYGLRRSMEGWTGRWRDRANRLPPWSLYQIERSASFLLGLVSMLRSGVALADAVERIGTQTRGRWSGRHIRAMQRRMREGAAGLTALECSLFDREVLDDLVIYGRLGSPEDAIESIGRNALGSVVERMTAVAKGLSMAGIIVAGFLIAGLNLAVNLQFGELAASGDSIDTTRL